MCIRDRLEGMFAAYRAGRSHYRANRGTDGGKRDAQIEVPCLWTDEFGVQSGTCIGSEDFAKQHQRFIEKRAVKLRQAEPLRRGELLPLDIGKTLTKPKQRASLPASFVMPVCVCMKTMRKPSHIAASGLASASCAWPISRPCTKWPNT